MTIGLPIFRDPRELRLDRLLTQPFRDDHAEPAEASDRGRSAVDRRKSGHERTAPAGWAAVADADDGMPRH